ncbi:periplasmic heavy metal sensor [Caenispirillum bisanense]|uniref:periplasmic heavy metal sensor n=1 Tax=Caenispirillum bisanense TaxID=414052 RepID=UPI0031D64DAF
MPLPRNRRTLVLIASLVLNVVLVAAVGTAGVKGAFDDDPRPDHRRPPFSIPGPHQLKEALPPEDHPVLEAVLAAHRPALSARIGAVHEARRAAAEALRLDPPDATRTAAALEALRQSEAAVSEGVYAMASDLLARLDGDGRKAVAALVESPRGRRGGGGPPAAPPAE